MSYHINVNPVSPTQLSWGSHDYYDLSDYVHIKIYLLTERGKKFSSKQDALDYAAQELRKFGVDGIFVDTEGWAIDLDKIASQLTGAANIPQWLKGRVLHSSPSVSTSIGWGPGFSSSQLRRTVPAKAKFDSIELSWLLHPDELGSDSETQLPPFISVEHIAELKDISGQYDLGRFVRHCEEINSGYESGSLISVLLLIRSMLNHIPPLFGVSNFSTFVNQSGKSVKDALLPLETELRNFADHYTHDMIRHKAPLPTRSMIDAFRARLAFLIQQVIVAATKP